MRNVTVVDVRSGFGECATDSLSVESEHDLQELRALGARFRHEEMYTAELCSEGAGAGRQALTGWCSRSWMAWP